MQRGGCMQEETMRSQDALMEQCQKNKELMAFIKERLDDAKTSVMINDANSGDALFRYNAKIMMKPASTMKLLTAGAALDYLGGHYRFATALYTTGEIDGSVLNGDVYLKGSGDPTLNRDKLNSLAYSLKQQGITTVNGRLYGDDLLFDNQLLTPGIWKHDESEYYAAPITALTMSPNGEYDTGSIIIDITANKIGKKPRIDITPSCGDLVIINNARTVKNRASLTVERKYKSNEIIVSGCIEVNETQRKWLTVKNPTTYTLALLKEEMKHHGIQMKKNKKMTQKKIPKYAELRKIVRSETLNQLLIPFMKLSNNGIADILTKTMGVEIYRQGTTEAGLHVVKSFLANLEIDEETWIFEDGSGMSHKNGVTTKTMNDYLYKIQHKEWFNEFIVSLPVAAKQKRLVGGTLRDRLGAKTTAYKVRAKTGSLSAVNTLAGYLETQTGRKLLISVYVEDAVGTIEDIDKIVEWIAKNY